MRNIDVKKIKCTLLSGRYLTFFALCILSLSVTVKWPETEPLESIRFVISLILANSLFKGILNRNMNIVSYAFEAFILVTFSVNYTTTIILKRITVSRVIIFILVVAAASYVITLGSCGIYLGRWAEPPTS